MDELLGRFDHRDPVALGRLLKEVENQTAVGRMILQHTAARQGQAHIVGITGPPGAGKSTLTGRLCKMWAEAGREIGIICIDPTSPFSGGALLGDRLRMWELSSYPNVFIKSLATRGQLGGISACTSGVVQLMDAYGKEIVVIETVGVGQVELEVMDLSDTVVLVNVPGLGDSIQTLKAGIMEIADVFVVNQADRPGADDSVRDLRLMLDERGNTGWARPVLKTVATTGEGIAELSEAVRRHREYLKQERLWEEKRQKRNRRRLMGELEAIFVALITDHLQNDPSAKVLREQVEAGREDPYSAAQKIMQHFLKAPRTGG